MNILNLISRNKPLFEDDLRHHEKDLASKVGNSRFLVLGGAGSIGQAVVKEIFKRNPGALHVIDISENNLVELVRDIRSFYGYIEGEFLTLPLDIASLEFDCFVRDNGPYDYILNLSALKHVRSEKDHYSLMRLIDVNIFNTVKTAQLAANQKSKKYFAVSTDKAANPVNMMGASKRIMEHFLVRESNHVSISTARFANVAFSDGSLLHGFNQRIAKKQPIVAPTDVKRYFVTSEESGQLCLFSALLGDNRDIFFPKLTEELHSTTFSDIAVKYLNQLGLEPLLCDTEDEARESAKSLADSIHENKKWPVYFFTSDTTGEKGYEEFFTEGEKLDVTRFSDLGIVKNNIFCDDSKLDYFIRTIDRFKRDMEWTKDSLVKLFKEILPDFQHEEKGRNLDQKM